MSVIFHATFWPCQMSEVYEDKISFNMHLHCQMLVKTSKCLFLKTFGCKFEVKNTEIQFYGHMSVNDALITQATDNVNSCIAIQ
jgi:hypothetical protein